RVLVIQSTYRGRWGRFWLRQRGLVWGRLAFAVARLAGAVRHSSCPLIPRRGFTRPELWQLFEEAGFVLRTWEPAEWWGLNISRDLFVLEPRRPLQMSPSSSRHAMKSIG